MTIAERVAEVRERVSAACGRSGRHPGEVTVIAVSKGRPPGAIEEVASAGILDLGESRAQELRDKVAAVSAAVRWHFMGAVQSNKIRYLDDVTLVHSLDRFEEAEALQRRAERTGRIYDVLVEVNVAAESSKQGIAPDELATFVESLAVLPLVRPRGLMMMAPMSKRAEDVRWVFAEARRLHDRVRPDGLEELSMGMTDDFEVAIEEGSTMVRIGRAIFGRG